MNVHIENVWPYEEGRILGAGQTVEIEVDWTWAYGELPSGKYRMVKRIWRGFGPRESVTYTVFAEFTVEGESASNVADAP